MSEPAPISELFSTAQKSAIKRILRGRVNVSTTQALHTVTIPGVAADKCAVQLLGTNAAGNSPFAKSIDSISSTSLVIYAQTASSGVWLDWQIVEYN